MVFNEFYSHFIDEEKEAVGGQMGTLGYKLGELVQQGRGTAQSQQILSPPRLSGPGLLDLVVLGYRALANTRVHTQTHIHTYLDKWYQQKFHPIFAILYLKVL